MIRSSRAVWGASLMALAACGDPISVEELAGGYPLGRVNAQSLPYLVSASIECDSWIEEGDLILDSGAQFALTLRGQLDCSRSGGPVQVVGWEFPGTYTISGNKLHFVSPSHPSGTIEFDGFVGPLQMRILVTDVELLPSLTAIDLEFRHS